jgi:hypothetical protein
VASARCLPDSRELANSGELPLDATSVIYGRGIAVSENIAKVFGSCCAAAALTLSLFAPVDSARAQDTVREWDRGCEDAKAGSYDRSSHTDAYEAGWQSCKPKAQERVGSVGREWDRGCEDAKVGSYDRSKHSDAYESGWQTCKPKPQPAHGSGADWDRGCSDAKVGSYDRSRHSSAYESGWKHCRLAIPAQKPSTPAHSKDWDRGCSDAKVGSYDRSSHSSAYESGWQSCRG